MSLSGGADPLVVARRVLLDALEALADHRDALVLIGAQAIYLHTGAAPIALPETTKDSDLAIDRRQLTDDPLLDEAMSRLLVGVTTQDLSSAVKGLLANELAAESTRVALDYFNSLFANGPEALGCHMAGRAEELLGEPAIIAHATAALAGDLVRALRD